MSVEITEGSLVLELDAERVLKWDDHQAFVQGIRKLPHTRGVDVCASVTGGGAVHIELKDYRAATMPPSAELARAIAEKVRDSLAGLVWACRRGLGEAFHEKLAGEFLASPKQRVIVWIEQNDLDAAGASALQDRIREELAPHIRAHVTVTSSLLEKSVSQPLPWLRARGLASPRIAQRPRRRTRTRKRT